MLAREIIKKMPKSEQLLVRQGFVFTGLCTGVIGYWNYREHMRKDFLRSEGHYKMS